MSRLIEIHHKGTPHQYGERDLPLTIGKSSGAQIPLQSGQAIEGYIGEYKGFLFLQPADNSSPVYHNGQHIEVSTWIKSGDTTRIGSVLLHYSISGDLVEIHVMGVDEKEVLMPPEGPYPDSEGSIEPLPRIKKGIKTRRWNRKISLLTIGFVMLLLAASFVLKGRSLEISVSPLPDSISVSGFPPVFKFGGHFLGLTGEYTIRATKAGYKKLEERITISAGKKNSYDFVFEKLPGMIDFMTTPVGGARIFVDDQDIGVTPLHDVQIGAGKHRIRLFRERYQDQEHIVDIKGLGQKQKFEYVLAPAWAEVTVTTEPAGASVMTGDREYGQTPLTFELLGGTHEIIFHKRDYSPHVLKLKVKAGASLSPEPVALELAPAFIELSSRPTGATVTVDGVYKGITPLTVELDARKKHAIALSLPGYKEFRKEITPTPGQKKELTFSLEPEYGTVFLTIEPPEAELYIDGKPQDKTLGRLQLTSREHTLEVRARGYKSKVVTVTPQTSYSLQVDIRLMPEGMEKQQVPLPDKINTGSGQELILLHPATFQMGSSRGEQGRRSNEYQQQVEISRAFYLGAREVTNAEFRLFKSNHFSGTFGRRTLDNDMQPVVNVSWEDAARYMNWLSRQDGLKPFYQEVNGKPVPIKPYPNGYRLPFEAEWAYAARQAGRQELSRYGWQGTFPPREKSGNYADESARTILPIVINGYNDSFAVSATVASFSSNPAGFFDLGGNVSEWCHNYYSPIPASSGKVAQDPVGPESGTHHIVRGASWRDGSITEVRLSYRGYSNEKRDDIGFRIARFAR